MSCRNIVDPLIQQHRIMQQEALRSLEIEAAAPGLRHLIQSHNIIVSQ
jgi:hypothetical protein